MREGKKSRGQLMLKLIVFTFAPVIWATNSALTVDSVVTLPPLEIDYEQSGSIQPKHSSEIPGTGWGLGRWSVGGETMDRDYTLFSEWRPYLGKLGAKAVRLQSGWAKTEKIQGEYSWGWLDTIVDGCVSQSVEPWMTICYANPVYGGGIKLHTDPKEIMEREDAWAAWKAYVDALVRRYADRIRIWEIWNEPPKEGYVDFFIGTAEVIRNIQPNSTIVGYHTIDKQLKEQGKLDLYDGHTFHGYPENPDEGNKDRLLRGHKLNGEFLSLQGETGCPSEYGGFGMLGKKDWLSELTQAKWNLRRMLLYAGRGEPANLFAIMDMKYRNTEVDTFVEVRDFNYKGLIKANPDRSVHHLKQAYYAAQHLFTLFDETLVNVTSNGFDFTAAGREEGQHLAIVPLKKNGSDNIAVSVWFNYEIPKEEIVPRELTLTFKECTFTDPVYVDIRTGAIFEIPAEDWDSDKAGDSSTFRDIPIYDSPVTILERSIIQPHVGARSPSFDRISPTKRTRFSFHYTPGKTPVLEFNSQNRHRATIYA